MVLRLLIEGSSIRQPPNEFSAFTATQFANCSFTLAVLAASFLDQRMRGLTLSHLQFDEQWTYVAKKQSRLTIDERAECHDIGDIYLWTCIDQKTKLLPSFLIGKRSADKRLPLHGGRCRWRSVYRHSTHSSDAHAFKLDVQYTPVSRNWHRCGSRPYLKAWLTSRSGRMPAMA